jgi:hypothetical protein
LREDVRPKEEAETYVSASVLFKVQTAVAVNLLVTITAMVSGVVMTVTAAMAGIAMMPIRIAIMTRIIFTHWRHDDGRTMARSHVNPFVAHWWRDHDRRRAMRGAADDHAFGMRKRKTESDIHTDACLGCSDCSEKNRCD